MGVTFHYPFSHCVEAVVAGTYQHCGLLPVVHATFPNQGKIKVAATLPGASANNSEGGVFQGLWRIAAGDTHRIV